MRDHEDEPQIVYLNDSVEAFVELIFGSVEGAYETSMGARNPFGYPWHLWNATQAAVWLGDSKRLLAVDDALAKTPSRGRRITALRMLVSGGAAVMEGRRDEGSAALREFLNLQAKVDLAWVRADGNAMAAGVLGPDDPVGRAAGEQTLEWCERVGAAGVAARYADILSPFTTEETAAG